MIVLQAGHSDSVADELTRALGLLAAHGVLQLTQSAAKAEPQQVSISILSFLPVYRRYHSTFSRYGLVNRPNISNKLLLQPSVILHRPHQHPRDKLSRPILICQ